MNTDAATQSRRANAMASFVELVAQTRREQLAGKHGGPCKQSNPANIAALDASAAKLRRAANSA